jgi:hypothetical protein
VVKRQGVALTTNSHPEPRLKKEYNYTSTPSLPSWQVIA